MGRSHYKIHNPQAVHFLTDTVVNWMPVFTRPDTVNIILNSFSYLQQQHDVKLYGYVILENHLHWVAQSNNLAKDVARFKSYTAKQILQYLELQKQHRLLKQLAFYKKKYKNDRQYQFWQEGSHPQEIQDSKMLLQKLNYIHQNPVKRGYVDEPIDWRYSSARNYAGKKGLIDVLTAW